MSLRLYLDHHVRAEVADGLRRRGVDVLTALEDGAATEDDEEPDKPRQRGGRVLFSQDRDMLRIAADRLQSGMPFSGLVYAHQLRITVGQAIEQLELLCTVYEPEDIQSDRVPAAVTTEPARVSREPIGHRAH